MSRRWRPGGDDLAYQIERLAGISGREVRVPDSPSWDACFETLIALPHPTMG